MKKRIYLIALLLVVLAACNNQSAVQNNTEEEIASLEARFFNEMNALDTVDANHLLSLYLRAADETKSDSMQAEYLFKAADLMMYHSNPRQTIDVYNRILDQHPTHNKAAMSLFLKAFVYDTRMADTANARKIYQEFLVLYPDNDFALDAQLAIQNLGKSVEDLVREFEAKNME